MGGKFITALVAGHVRSCSPTRTRFGGHHHPEHHRRRAQRGRRLLASRGDQLGQRRCRDRRLPGRFRTDTIVLTGGSTYVRSLTGVNEDANGSGDLDIRAGSLTIQVVGPGGAIIEGTGAPSGSRVIQILDSVAVSITG